MFTRGEILREYHRLCGLVNEAEIVHGLLDVDQAQAMRDRYRERADAVLVVCGVPEKVGS